MPGGVQGLGMDLPDLRSKKKGKQKVAKESHASEALDKLREQTREAVKGLESVSGPKLGGENLGNDAMVEDWVKQFEELAGSQVLNFFQLSEFVCVNLLEHMNEQFSYTSNQFNWYMCDKVSFTK